MQPLARNFVRYAGGGLLALLLLVFLVDAIYPFVWISAPLSGQVVDGRTGKGIPGAVVAATWLLTGIEGAPVRYLQIAETVSGEDGRFSLDAWGPRFVFKDGRLRPVEPKVFAFADGYAPRVVYRRKAAGTLPFVLTYGYLKESPLSLAPAAADAALEEAFEPVLTALRFVYFGRCDWTKLPLTFSSIERARATLSARGFSTALPSRTFPPAQPCTEEPSITGGARS